MRLSAARAASLALQLTLSVSLSRSKNIPMFSISGHDDKVLDVAWPTANVLASGGANGNLQVRVRKEDLCNEWHRPAPHSQLDPSPFLQGPSPLSKLVHYKMQRQ